MFARRADWSYGEALYNGCYGEGDLLDIDADGPLRLPVQADGDAGPDIRGFLDSLGSLHCDGHASGEHVPPQTPTRAR